MNKKKMIGSMLGIAALCGLAASQAFAGTCRSRPRNIPSAGTDVMEMTCRHNSSGRSAATLTARTQGATKILSADLREGTVSASASGLDSAGNGIAQCTALDSLADRNPVTLSCSAAVKWRSVINFAE